MKYNEESLRELDFSEIGAKRFINTINEFEEELLEKSIIYGKTNQEKNTPLEITSDDVRNAVIKIRNTQISQKKPPWFIFLNILEYVFTALAAFSLAWHDKNHGVVFFIAATAIVVILITIRLTNNRR